MYVQQAPNAGKITPAPSVAPRRGSHSTRGAGRLTSIALIAYALFLAFLAGAFMEYVMAPLPVEQQAGTGLRDIKPECWAAPDLFNCLNYIPEPQ